MKIDKKIFNFLPAFLLLSFTFYLLPCSAQQDLTLYNMTTVPQLKYANPAKWMTCRYYIAFPLASSFYANFSHSAFAFSDLVEKRSDDSINLKIDNVMAMLNKSNYFSLGVQAELIALGFKSKAAFISFNITEKFFFRFSYPKDLFELAWKGNSAFIGRTADFTDLTIRSSWYREYAIGYSRIIKEKLSVGGKVKWLYGIMSSEFKPNELSLYTGTVAENYELRLRANVESKTSSPFYDSLVEKDYFVSTAKNNGFGLDLGFDYRINQRLSVSGSVIDIGFINWKSNVKNYTSESNSTNFKGIPIDLFADRSDSTNPFQAVFDSLKSTMDTIYENNNPFSTPLLTRMYAGVNFYIKEEYDVAALFHGEFFSKSFYPSFTFSFNARIKKWLGASISYSILNKTYNNVGLGFSVKGGPFQLYVVSDNLFWLFDLGKTAQGAIFPRSARNLQLRFGFNFIFGCEKKVKDKDKDGIPDKEDDCPTDPGLKEFAGCPDRDGDKIIDKNDDCPDDPGLAIFRGCPDRDGDSLTDKRDSCPDVAGLIANRGCPVKLYMINAMNDTLLETDYMDDDSVFIFEMLPGKESFIFMLDADDSIKMIYDAVKVKVRNNETGQEEVISAPKSSDGLFRFEYIPYQRPRLFLITAEGDTLMMAAQDEEGFFVFRNLPPDRTYLFLLAASDADSLLELNIKLINKDGQEYTIKASKESANLFKYEPLPGAFTKLQQQIEPEVPVMLKEEEKEILKTAFSNLEFEKGSNVIRVSSFASLDELCAMMKKKPEWGIVLSGHTDNIGSESSNKILSGKRADAVKKHLTKCGISQSSIVTRTYGESKPIADNNTPEGRQQNRRVEMLIVQSGVGGMKEQEIVAEGGAAKTPNLGVSATAPAIVTQAGIVFRVQILAAKKRLPADSPLFKGEKISEYVDGGYFKYTIGETGDFMEARKISDKVRSKGFGTAFIVAFRGRNRISLDEALKK